MTNLRTIRLRNNQLTRIPKDAFTGLRLLDVIDLSSNSISTIEENPYADLPDCDDTTCIQLRENPLNCDCHLAWFKLFANTIEDSNNNKPSWKCAEPKSVAGQSLVSLDILQFSCGTVTSATQPSATQPSVTQPSATQPSATQPSATQPSATQPSATQPSATQPSATQPSATQPSATQPNDGWMVSAHILFAVVSQIVVMFGIPLLFA